MPESLQDICFVISPIGDEGSPERKAADHLLKYVITPVAQAVHGYEVQRADKIVEAGSITRQIIEYLVEAPVVIADMTDHNPNVFYELAVRHAAKKPVIHMIQAGQRIPFDVAAQRTIFYTLDLDGVDQAKTSLTAMLAAIKTERESEEPDSPLTNALDRIMLGRSHNPVDQRESQLLELVQDMHVRLVNLGSAIGQTSQQGDDNELALRLSDMAEELGSLVGIVSTMDESGEMGMRNSELPQRQLYDLILSLNANYRSLLGRLRQVGALSGVSHKHLVNQIASRIRRYARVAPTHGSAELLPPSHRLDPDE